MPKPTFFRLEASKRKRFIEVALREFSQNSYSSTSINQIAQSLEIAKGSIYQYFKDKQDLYLYLIEYANQEKQRYLQAHLGTPKGDFFEQLEQLYRVNQAFDLEHGLVRDFLAALARENKAGNLGDFRARLIKQGVQAYSHWLGKAYPLAELRSDIDQETLALFLYQISEGGRDYFANFTSKSTSSEPDWISHWMKILKEGLLGKP